MALDLSRLRTLRARAEVRSGSFIEDFSPFVKADHTFCRTPEKKGEAGASVTTVCTCLMAGALTRRFPDLYKVSKGKSEKAARLAFRTVLDSDWKSAGLSEGNNFTRVLALRTAGLLKKEGILTGGVLDLKHKNKTLREIGSAMLKRIPGSFAVKKFRPNAAIAYWFLDAIDHLELDVAEKDLGRLVDWAAETFGGLFSYVVANHDALLDPVAMIMAACVVKRLHKWRVQGRLSRSVYERLPPIAELRHSVSELFRFQGKSGIWPKYFPLFNYPKTGASNYCFTFEFLEATLAEFSDAGSRIFDVPAVMSGLERALDWCDENRFEFFHNGETFFGWNSGTEIELLRAGVPESWATGTVHMFLATLKSTLSEAIDDTVVASWVKPRNFKDWDTLIDSPVRLQAENTSFKKVVAEQILDKLVPHPKSPRNSYRSRPIGAPRCSAILFGPPGTSKTTFVRALAAKLNWPYFEITPSDFVGQGLDQIYARTNDIFRDLMDVAGVVVLFDEMDALAQKRGGDGAQQLDLVRQLLTTSMLPKLTDIHDSKRIIYFMNTNHLESIDGAIRRSGRFDMLLHVTPPAWEVKLQHLSSFYQGDAAELEKSANILKTFLAKKKVERELLDLFTFAEMKSFLEHIRRVCERDLLSDALQALGRPGFLALVAKWGKKSIVLRKGSADRKEFDKDKRASTLQ